jgi:hypothetical protein
VERTVRILLGQRAVDEGEGLSLLVRCMEFQAEMYKQMGLWTLAVAIYLDCADLATSLIGFDTIEAVTAVTRVSSCLRKMNCGALEKKYIRSLCDKLEKESLSEFNTLCAQKIADEDRVIVQMKRKHDQIWTNHIALDAPKRALMRRSFVVDGCGGVYKLFSSTEGFYTAARSAFLYYCECKDPSGTLNKYAQFAWYCFRLRHVDNGEIVQHLVQHLVQKYLAKSLVPTCEIARIYRDVTAQEHIDSVVAFLHYGNAVGLEVFDNMLAYALKRLVKPFRSFFYGHYGGSLRDQMVIQASEGYDAQATRIQIVWRSKLARRKMARVRAGINAAFALKLAAERALKLAAENPNALVLLHNHSKRNRFSKKTATSSVP